MNEIELLEHLYDRFNARDLESVCAMVADDVMWANGMHGGHVHGRDGLRAYWVAQWQVVSPHVRPVRFERESDDGIVAEVSQTIRDLDGNPLADQSHGLRDRTVRHVFRFAGGKVSRFDIRDDIA
jgi:ketosteroid isomerase-like protein